MRLSQLDLRDAGQVTPLVMCFAFSPLIERQCLEGAELQSRLRRRLHAPSRRYRGVPGRGFWLGCCSCFWFCTGFPSLASLWGPIETLQSVWLMSNVVFLVICADTDRSVSSLYYRKYLVGIWYLVLRLMLTGEHVKG